MRIKLAFPKVNSKRKFEFTINSDKQNGVQFNKKC